MFILFGCAGLPQQFECGADLFLMAFFVNPSEGPSTKDSSDTWNNSREMQNVALPEEKAKMLSAVAPRWMCSSQWDSNLSSMWGQHSSLDVWPKDNVLILWWTDIASVGRISMFNWDLINRYVHIYIYPYVLLKGSINSESLQLRLMFGLAPPVRQRKRWW